MKDIKFFGLLSVAALAMSVSSCTNDNEPVISENETGNNTEGVFTIKANIGELQQTRAKVKPEDGKSFTWQQNDVFSLYQSSDMTTANTFTIDNNNINPDGKSADFNCSSFAPASDATYYAFYPQGFTTTDNTTFTYTIPDGVYTQTGDNNTDHLSKGMIMIATGSSADIQNSVTFKHKTALFRFGISNLKSEAVTVKSIKLSSSGTPFFGKKYVYNIDGTESVDSKSTELNLNFGEGVTLYAKGTDGNIMKAYTLAIPADAITSESGETFTLTVTYNDNSTIENKFVIGIGQPFVAGNVYTFNLDIDYNRYYITGNYNEWSWENCQYIYYNTTSNSYKGRVYFDSKGVEDEQYQFKITQYKNWIKSWGLNNNNIIKNKKSCMVEVKTENGNDKVYTWDDADSWGVVGGFNNWGNSEEPDVEMQYGFDGDHYLIADVTFEEGDELTWKLRPDNIWAKNGDNSQIQINTGSGVVIEGEAGFAADKDQNFKVTDGAGTYEFKWYFNLPQPKIVVTKKII